jgi:hypothetical protein
LGGGSIGLLFLPSSSSHALPLLDVSASPESAPRVFLALGDVSMAFAVALQAPASMFIVWSLGLFVSPVLLH